MLPDTDVVVALGSNRGDRLRWLRRGRDALLALPGVTDGYCASVWESEAVDCEPGAETFFNSTMLLRWRNPGRMPGPHDLLATLLGIETGCGRERSAQVRSRTLDLDLILYANARIDDERLTVPHPAVEQRAFVLLPLRQLLPDLRLGQGRTLDQCLEGLDSGNCRRLDLEF